MRAHSAYILCGKDECIKLASASAVSPAESTQQNRTF